MKMPKSDIVPSSYILIGVTLSLFILYFDQSGVATTAWIIHNDLQISHQHFDWIMNSYFIPMCMFIIFSGNIADKINLKNSFLIGLTGFILASFFCIIAQTPFYFFLARVFQGFFAGIFIPAIVATVANIYEPNERPFALGITIGGSILGLVIGPIIAGIFSFYFSWRLIFITDTLLGLLALFLISSFLHIKPNDSRQFEVNWINNFLLSAIVLFLLFTGSLLKSKIYSMAILFIIISVSLIIIFLIAEKKSTVRAIDKIFLQNNSFIIANVLMFYSKFMFMWIIYLCLYFQISLHFDIKKTGIAIVPMLLFVTISSPIFGKLQRYIDGVYLILFSLITICIVQIYFIYAFSTINYLYILIGMILFGISIAGLLSPSIHIGLSEFSEDYRGRASGLLGFSREFGGIIGLVLMNFIIFLPESIEHAEKAKFFATRMQYGFISTLVVTIFLLLIFIGYLFFIKPRLESLS